MNRRFSSGIRIGCFVFILAFFLSHVFHVLRFKNFDGIYNFEKFYQLEDNSVDVLALGSSHAFCTFNTGYLYENYGIAAYVLGGSAQPIWNTYYYLEEALETQKPKMIVLEAYSLARWDVEYAVDPWSPDSEKAYMIKNTYGIKPLVRKYESMKVSIPEERFSEYFPTYIQSHSKYSELGKKDFYDNQGGIAFYKNWHGFSNVTVTTPCEMPDLDGYTEKIPLMAKNEEYFRKILELARYENIPIIVVVAPYVYGMIPEHQMKYNTVKEIADEYSVDFINFNSSEMYKKIGLNFDTDFSDGAHLNYIGNVKVSKYVADYILAMTDMPDRRGDLKYKPWELDAAYIDAMNRDKMLTETTEIEKIKDIFDNSKYIYFVSSNISEGSEQIAAMKRYLGLTENYGGSYIIDGTTGEIMIPESYVWYELEGIQFTYDWYGINVNYSQFHPENGIIDEVNSLYKYSDKGMLIVVYDSITLEIADAFYINIEDDVNVMRK